MNKTATARGTTRAPALQRAIDELMAHFDRRMPTLAHDIMQIAQRVRVRHDGKPIDPEAMASVYCETV